MPFWKPPKVETLAREIAEGHGKDPDADAEVTTIIEMPGAAGWTGGNLKNWQLYIQQAENLIALFAQELTGKNLPLPRLIMQIKERPRAIALEFASVAQADLFARCIQALRLRADAEPEGEIDDVTPLDVRVPKAD